jgi:hypothetical protein
VITDELDDAVARTATIRDEEVAALPLADAKAALLAELIGAHAESPTPRAVRRWRPWVMRVGALAAACVAVAVVLLSGSGSPSDPGGTTAFAEGAVEIAEANPRLLITAPGWSVTSADEFTLDQGETTFGNGEQSIELTWYPAHEFDGYLQDRAMGSDSTSVEVLGKPAFLFDQGNGTLSTMLPPDGGTFVEIRQDEVESPDAYRELLESLRAVDVPTWLGALPASIVEPEDRDQALKEMLRGLPLPPGLDVAKLERGGLVTDRYQFGADVTAAVACGWMDRWFAGMRSGDTEKIEEAVAAMGTARSWPILKEMQPQGGYPAVVWSFADYIAGEKYVDTPGERYFDGRSYVPSLGCRDR